MSLAVPRIVNNIVLLSSLCCLLDQDRTSMMMKKRKGRTRWRMYRPVSTSQSHNSNLDVIEEGWRQKQRQKVVASVWEADFAQILAAL